MDNKRRSWSDKMKTSNKFKSSHNKKEYTSKRSVGDKGVHDFENVNMIKKNSVRGLFRKRAKKYECTLINDYFILYI
jgi:hypothetical protein